MGRIQSPSSINTYKQCPRKYYYSYIDKLPRETNIHCIRGNIVHEVLENFFKESFEGITQENFIQTFSIRLKNQFNSVWDKYSKELKKLNLENEKLQFYYQESLMMLANWINTIIKRVHERSQKTSFEEALKFIKPDMIEQKFNSEKYRVMGYIDCIHHKDGKIKVIDYKTSKSGELKPEYKLQLGIYAVLYEEQFGKRPDEVGLWVLKHGEVMIPVTDQLINDTKFEIEQIHLSTETTEIKDYPKKQSPLCKWSSGKCDFYDECFRVKQL